MISLVKDHRRKFTLGMTTSRMTNTTPVVWFRTLGVLLLAKRAAMRAQSRVDRTQKIRAHRSATPPMAKWLTEPVKAVKAMINTLVPTAVFNS